MKNLTIQHVKTRRTETVTSEQYKSICETMPNIYIVVTEETIVEKPELPDKKAVTEKK